MPQWLLCSSHVGEDPDPSVHYTLYLTFLLPLWSSAGLSPCTTEQEFAWTKPVKHPADIAPMAGEGSQDAAPMMWRALADDALGFSCTEGSFPARGAQSQTSWCRGLCRGLSRKGGPPPDLWARRTVCPLAPGKERRRHPISHSDVHGLISMFVCSR